MTLYAHSGSEPDKSDWQELREHLEAVAKRAAEMAKPLGLEKAALLAGLFHDLGKYTAAFQKRLEGGPSVDHSTAGAWHVLQAFAGSDSLTAELIAYCILGHHAGLPDRKNAVPSCFDQRIEAYVDDLPQVWRNDVGVVTAGLTELAAFKPHAEYLAFQMSLIVRMIFSCLVDADRKDSERYSLALQGKVPDRTWSALQDILPELVIAFDRHMNGMSKQDTDLNRLRDDILKHVREKAVTMSPGLFTLTVPTGGGKTLASMGFALDHAMAHSHSRIIYAIPFTGAWIETAAESSRPNFIASPPARGRGSKQLHTDLT
ncbi:MAG: CRISPR-associated helicase, Cas3 family [Rhizobium sp.]|nr:CRISPR-associated helicase, Cas3 family [Rhizobium sp.]